MTKRTYQPLKSAPSGPLIRRSRLFRLVQKAAWGGEGGSFPSSSITGRARRGSSTRGILKFKTRDHSFAKSPEKRGNSSKGSSSKRIPIIAAGLVATMTIALFMVTMVASNTLATQGGSSGGVNTEIRSLQNENANLQAQIASLTAVSRIYTEAKKKGYVEPDKVIYAAPASPVALKSN